MKNDTHKIIETILDHVYPTSYTIIESVDTEIGLTILSAVITPVPHRDIVESIQILLQQIATDDTVCIDINGELIREIQRIKEEAYMHVQKALYYNQPSVLQPMNAFARKIIHGYAGMHKNVRSESEGTGRDRHIVIYPGKQ
jgi:hypothetical protein